MPRTMLNAEKTWIGILDFKGFGLLIASIPFYLFFRLIQLIQNRSVTICLI